jgi:hypothetical protein
MPISKPLALQHIAQQTARLRSSRQRAFWPKYLYHATHVVNAVRILEGGQLLSRNEAKGFHDIANQGALNAYADSHDYARLYFRPKNGFHLRTEGIKCFADPHRQDFQASVPVSLIFKFEEVITRPGVKFTKGNIQRAHNVELDGDEAFGTLHFEAIYHDDYVTPETRDYIHDCRMAEVMVPGSVPLLNNLRAIVFRTRYDLITFQHYLGARIKCTFDTGVESVSQSLFMHWGLYVTELSYVEDALIIKFHFPKTQPPDSTYSVRVVQSVAGSALRVFDKRVLLRTSTLRITGFVAEAQAVWRIDLEGVLAFEGKLAHKKSEVFGPK